MRVCFLTAAVLTASLRLVMAGPDIAVTVPADGAVVSALTSLRVTFSEPVTGVNATDLGVNGNPAAGVTGSGAGPYVFTFPQPPAGTVSFSWDVDQSIAGLGTGEFVPVGSITVTLTDNLPPQLAKLATSVPGQEMDDVQPSPGSVAGMIRQAVVNFSEEVSGVDAADLLVNGVAAAAVTGSAAGPYVFQFDAVAEGMVQFSWAASHGIADAAGNLFAGTGWSAVRAATAGQVVIPSFSRPMPARASRREPTLMACGMKTGICRRGSSCTMRALGPSACGAGVSPTARMSRGSGCCLTGPLRVASVCWCGFPGRTASRRRVISMRISD
jgi:hypothetical protein